MNALAVLCPGQGDQHPAMLDFALSTAAGRLAVEETAQALGRDPRDTLRGGQGLFQNALAQPLVCAAGLATWAALRRSLPGPAVLAGYSLGELVAHGCAGALTPAGAVLLASARAALMDAAAGAPGGLVALRGVSLARAESLAAEVGAEIAIVNGPDHFVFGGRADVLRELERRAPAAGASTVRRLAIGVPAHTRLLAGAVGPFAALLRESGLLDPAVPVLAGVTGAPVRRRDEAVDALSRQLAERIEWARCLATAAEMGCSVFLELGPGTALSRMAREVVPGVEARSVDEFRSLEGVVRWVEAGLAR